MATVLLAARSRRSAGTPVLTPSPGPPTPLSCTPQLLEAPIFLKSENILLKGTKGD